MVQGENVKVDGINANLLLKNPSNVHLISADSAEVGYEKNEAVDGACDDICEARDVVVVVVGRG